MEYKELLFGTAGIPLSCEGHNADGVRKVKELGLGCMELEFVRSVNLSRERAEEVREAASGNKIELSCHGSYFINFNSMEIKKVAASRKRILDAARIAWAAGAKSLTFHAAFYQGIGKEKVYGKVKAELGGIVKVLEKEKNGIWLRPELTGKKSQFGDLEELIRLSSEVGQVLPCIDFAHLHARYNGEYNSYKEFSLVLDEIREKLGKSALKNMHIHVSGINYSEKGERNHLNLKDSDFNYKELIRALKKSGAKGLVICESPNIESDALLMQRAYKKIK